jgi:MoxR-like ATPase
MVPFSEATKRMQQVVEAVEKVIIGKTRSVRLAVTALFAGGHLLIEDIPGVGKTTLAKALARCIGGTFKRIQFTPDLLPSDITGTTVYNQKTGEFTFRPGAIFANIVLADEINRSPPRTQSALLEAMEEAQVTVDGVTYALPQPFFVIATQNPIERHGTYPLPEAQLDRFLMQVKLGYPQPEEEATILQQQAITHPIEQLQPCHGQRDSFANSKASSLGSVDALSAPLYRPDCCSDTKSPCRRFRCEPARFVGSDEGWASVGSIAWSGIRHT